MDNKEIYVRIYAAALTGVVSRGAYEKRSVASNLTEYAFAASEAKKFADAAIAGVKERLRHGT